MEKDIVVRNGKKYTQEWFKTKNFSKIGSIKNIYGIIFNDKGKILIDEKGRDGQWIGRNYAYKPIILEGEFTLGDKVNVEIVKTEKFALRGKV